MLKSSLLFTIALLPNLAELQLISTQCRQDVYITLQEAFINQADWALRMIDASTKFPDGLLYGHWDHLGHWDECLSVSSDDALITGKFCRATLIAFFNETNNIR